MRFAGVILALACVSHAPTAVSGATWAEAARANKLDPLILYAVALQESRMLWSDGSARPWPWTLRSASGGAGRFATRQAAAEALDRLLKAGEHNVDIGLMQVNWGFHGHRVATPDQLLDPRRNIRIAAEILGEAMAAEAGDLARALGAYHHGADTARGRAYSAQVRRRLARLRTVPGLCRALAGASGAQTGGRPGP